MTQIITKILLKTNNKSNGEFIKMYIQDPSVNYRNIVKLILDKLLKIFLKK